MFNRLYFDSSILLAGPWPKPSANIESVLKMAPAAGVLVFIPAPVEAELEYHWMRDFDDRRHSLTAGFEAFKLHCETVGNLELNLGGPSREVALTAYRQHVLSLRQKYNIGTVPFTSRLVTDIFTMACRYQPPFKRAKDGDAGFRDAIIFLSVVDDVRSVGNAVGALVSGDRIFKHAEIASFARAQNVRIEIHASVDAIYDALMGSVAETVKKVWDEQTAIVERRLLGHKEEIREFITRTLEVPAVGVVPSGRVRWAHRIEVLGIRNVRIPHPWDTQATEAIRFSFDVEAKLYITVEKYVVAEPRRVKVGEPSDEERFFAGIAPIEVDPRRISPELEQIDVVLMVRIEAMIREKGFEYESARLLPETLSEALTQLAPPQIEKAE